MPWFVDSSGRYLQAVSGSRSDLWQQKDRIGRKYADTYTQNMNLYIEEAGGYTTEHSTKWELGRLW